MDVEPVWYTGSCFAAYVVSCLLCFNCFAPWLHTGRCTCACSSRLDPGDNIRWGGPTRRYRKECVQTRPSSAQYVFRAGSHAITPLLAPVLVLILCLYKYTCTSIAIRGGPLHACTSEGGLKPRTARALRRATKHTRSMNSRLSHSVPGCIGRLHESN